MRDLNVEFTVFRYHPKYLVVASDGIWDVLDDQEVVELINEYAYAGSIAKQIAQDAINWYSHDNIAILIITFEKKAIADDSDEDDDEDEDDEDGEVEDGIVEDGENGSGEKPAGKREEL